MEPNGRSWFRAYSREWRRLVVLASSEVDACDRADRRWRTLGDEARECRLAGVREVAEHQASERWASVTVRGT